MKELFALIRATLIGGLIFLVPFFLIVVIILKAVEILRKIVTPWATELGVSNLAGRATITILIIVIMVLICLIAGLIFRSGRIEARFPLLDAMADRMLPGYEILKAESKETGVSNIRDAWQAIYLKTEEGWCLAFIVEQKSDEYKAVFIPHVPRMDEGDLRIFPSKSMEYFPISSRDARLALRRFGFGAAEGLSKLKS
ncbi:MAG TPA: hypothetical protein VMH01_06520 [Puia sp.]|nr:hypothetical protein [Puia sp.]